MCPIFLNGFVELLQPIATAFHEGDGSPLRKLVVQYLSAVTHLDAFQVLADIINITPDEVRDSQLFSECGSLELMKHLALVYEISKFDVVEAFYGAIRRESLADASWLADQFQLTKQDLFPAEGNITSCIRGCRNLDLVKWLVEKYQITLDDLGANSLPKITRSSNTGLVRWMASTYKFERDDVVKAFLRACVVGNLEIAKFLTEFYKLTADEIRRENLALKMCDNLFLREWLLDNYYSSN